MPYPDVPTTQHFRHTWVITKRPRPVAPLFIGAPVPQKRNAAFERSALLTMAYFRPWTLRQGDADAAHVPHAGCLRDAAAGSWEDSLSSWLDGNVISQESVRYISIFLSVYRVRPRDPNEDVRSDEDLSDQESEVREDDLEEALKTRIGGRDKNTETKQQDDGKATHEDNSRTGMYLANHVWVISKDVEAQESIIPTFTAANAEAAKEGAKASRRQDAPGVMSTEDKKKT